MGEYADIAIERFINGFSVNKRYDEKPEPKRKKKRKKKKNHYYKKDDPQ